MQIEVVKPGDSLYAISRKYGVSTEQILAVNGLSDPSRLVVGQALLIPTAGRRHVVRAGESLWSIAQMYQVSVQALIQANGIQNPASLQVGTVLVIPEAAKVTIESNAYLQPSTAIADRRKVEEAARALTYVSIFSYRVQESGDLTAPNDVSALTAIEQTKASPMMTITNFKDGTFSADIGKAIFDDADARSKLIDNVISTMKAKGYTALNIDFEHLYATDRQRYNAFLREITPKVREQGFKISTALAPKTSAEQVGEWYEAHDYPAHGQIVDFVIIMTYEWGWSGGPPMAVAPINQVRRVLNYAVSVIPRNKIMMGAPLYGYDWTLPYVKGGPFAKTLGLNEAVELAASVGASIQYDYTAQSPHFTYYDSQGKEHIVWFEDVRSMKAKFNLIKEYGLRGVSYWALGKPAPQIWNLLLDTFNVRSYK